MNTLATYVPNMIAKADSLLVAPGLAFRVHQSKLRVWAFAAAVRLADQDRPIALKLLVELAIVLRMLAQAANNAECVTDRSKVTCRATKPFARAHAGRVKSAGRNAKVQPGGIRARGVPVRAPLAGSGPAWPVRLKKESRRRPHIRHDRY